MASILEFSQAGQSRWPAVCPIGESKIYGIRPLFSIPKILWPSSFGVQDRGILTDDGLRTPEFSSLANNLFDENLLILGLG